MFIHSFFRLYSLFIDFNKNAFVCYLQYWLLRVVFVQILDIILLASGSFKKGKWVTGSEPALWSRVWRLTHKIWVNFTFRLLQNISWNYREMHLVFYSLESPTSALVACVFSSVTLLWIQQKVVCFSRKCSLLRHKTVLNSFGWKYEQLHWRRALVRSFRCRDTQAATAGFLFAQVSRCPLQKQ